MNIFKDKISLFKIEENRNGNLDYKNSLYL